MISLRLQTSEPQKELTDAIRKSTIYPEVRVETINITIWKLLGASWNTDKTYEDFLALISPSRVVLLKLRCFNKPDSSVLPSRHTAAIRSTQSDGNNSIDVAEQDWDSNADGQDSLLEKDKLKYQMSAPGSCKSAMFQLVRQYVTTSGH